MARIIETLLFAGAATILLAGAPAQAQSTSEQTVEQMAEKFKKQKTRGLVIATPSVNSDSSGSTETTTAAAVEQIASAVPKEEQVNVNVTFDFDSAALRADQKPKLVQLCSALKAADVQKIRILGHTDAAGSVEYNERLSRLRAEEVKRFLSSDCGYPEDRMEALGVGERFPFDPENPRADVNRRVEFQALS